MKINKQLKIEKFFKEQLWQHLIVVAFVFICAWLFDKYIEAVLFCTSHFFIRKYFDKQYHCDHKMYAVATLLCLSLTLTIAYFGIANCLPLTVSLLSTIPLCFFISWVGYLAQDRIDNIADNKSLTKEIDNLLKKIKEYENIDLYKLTEQELRQYGASKQLSEIQQDILVMRVIEHLKISEICRYRNYGRTTIKYHIAEIKKKLNIEQI